VELDETRAQFEAQGLGLCSISYDSVEVLAHFAARKGITIPLLSDPASEIIRRFGLLNETIPPTNARDFGIPHPGTLIVDEREIVRHKFFEERYIHRVTMPTILARGFGLPGTAQSKSLQTDQVAITATATQDRVRPGNRFALIVEVVPSRGVHIYAPGAEAHGYYPLALTIDPPACCTVYAPRYPEAEILELPTLKEAVPVYTHPARIEADIALGSRQELADALAAGKLPIRGRVAVQACDDTACYAPQEIPVLWEVVLEPVDTERVPDALRREHRASSP
jgi:hypothetical protein